MKRSLIALALVSTCVTSFATEYRFGGNERNFEGHSRHDRDDRGNNGNGRGRPEVLPRNPGVVLAPPITITTPVPSVSTTVRSDLNVNNVLSNTNNVAGGNATASVKVATGDNVNNNTNNNRNVARGGAGGAGGSASVTTGNVTNENNSAGGAGGSVSINTPRVAASAYAPTIIHSGGADSCMGSSSGGIQGLSVGVSVGSTWKDEHCEMLRDVVRLNEIGAKETAYARMCADPKLRQAFELSGEFDCTTGKFRKVAAPVVVEKVVEVIKEVPVVQTVEVVRTINVEPIACTKPAVKKATVKKTNVCKG